ncbi:transposase [Cyclobacterium qasimii]|uniref:Transposase IS204/IS1001/IS1096/IS1165 DDE domain-containing protein n=1 Tax=Cyclobacterium qasimii TaxID=1350429 RepID=A0A512CAH0_9BACT|nr:transposase [Cyclobacterium qasimii]GEO21194.1 hypothetical protein CQA01_17280 [Cyclobacterium qasimii]
MPDQYQKIVGGSFRKAHLVTDRFHVQKMVYDAVQEMRIFHRWEAIDQENKEIELSKELKKSFNLKTIQVLGKGLPNEKSKRSSLHQISSMVQ